MAVKSTRDRIDTREPSMFEYSKKTMLECNRFAVIPTRVSNILLPNHILTSLGPNPNFM